MALANELEEFIQGTGDLLRDAALPFYRKRRYFPVDGTTLYENSIYASALYLRAKGIAPSKESLNQIFFEDGSIMRVSLAYEELGEDLVEAERRYCEHMNAVLFDRASRKGIEAYIWLPDVGAYRKKIEKLLKNKSDKH